MEEDLGPYTIKYIVNAPASLSDFAIRYTDEEGNEVLQPTESPFAFPFVEILDPIPSTVAGTYRASISGFASEGGVTVQVELTRDGLIVQQEQGSDQSTGPNDDLSASAEIVID